MGLRTALLGISSSSELSLLLRVNSLIQSFNKQLLKYSLSGPAGSTGNKMVNKKDSGFLHLCWYLQITVAGFLGSLLI